MVRMMQLGAALTLFAGLAARADDAKPAEKPFDDATFVMMAASDGMHEIELGKIAVGHAKRDDVKKFADMLVKDHTKAGEDLRAVAKAANIPVPAKMNEHDQAEVDMFRKYKGADFDGEFVKHEVADHTKAIALFTRASKEAKNPAIKDFATKTLPVLEKHLEAAKKLQK